MDKLDSPLSPRALRVALAMGEYYALSGVKAKILSSRHQPSLQPSPGVPEKSEVPLPGNIGRLAPTRTGSRRTPAAGVRPLINAEHAVADILAKSQRFVERLFTAIHDVTRDENATPPFEFRQEPLTKRSPKAPRISFNERTVSMFGVSLPAQVKRELHHVRRVSVECGPGKSHQFVSVERRDNQVRVIEDARSDLFAQIGLTNAVSTVKAKKL
jgi:hypothetical protein